jgi:glycerophosphoryl diester phosphodiesterase
MTSPELPASLPQGRPLVLGHRGAAADAPENTLASFRLALEQGADGVELDVWRCATGEVVVFHDEDAHRIAGSPLRIRDAPLAALRVLDAGAWKGERFAGERVPLLAEVLEALPRALVNVELKGRGRDVRVAAAAAAVIRGAGAAGRTVVSSFDFGLLAAFRAAAPEVPVGLLFEGGRPWRLRTALAVRLLRPAAVHPDLRLATAERVARWRRRGLSVNVWTVDAPEEARRLAGLGVSALITNAPGRTLAALGAPGGIPGGAGQGTWSRPPTGAGPNGARTTE